MSEIEKRVGHFKSYDGTSIYYESRGSGVPIVFIYGLACQMNHWHHQMIHFSKNWQVINFDIRGHHQSEVPSSLQELTIEAIAKDTIALMENLGLQKAHFVGHSFGVPVLIMMNHLRPDLALSYSFVNGFAKNPMNQVFGFDIIEPAFRLVKTQYNKAPELWTQVWKAVTDNPATMMITAFSGGFNFKLTQFKDIEIYSKGVAQTPLKVFLALFEALMKFDGESLLHEIKQPTLLIGGDSDTITPVRYQQQMHDCIKGSELLLIPYGSHCTQLDFPDYVNLRLETLFEQVEK